MGIGVFTSQGLMGVVVCTSQMLTLELVHIVSVIREGNGTPLQYSCLENPRDGGAWWAAVYGVAQSRTRLNDLAAAAYAISEFMLHIFLMINVIVNWKHGGE